MKQKLEKINRLWVVVAIMITLIILTLFACEVRAQQRYVDDFYRDAAKNNVSVSMEKFEFSIVSLHDSNSRLTKKHDHYLVEIDNHFFVYYNEMSQLKRLVYYNLGRLLLNAKDTTGNKIMNPNLVYRELTTSMVNELFKENKL